MHYDENGILTFLFAFCPGAGQMYQGYMKRGLSLITMFCLFIMAGALTGLDPLIVGCLIVWMYSFLTPSTSAPRSAQVPPRRTTIWCTSTGRISAWSSS